jgi:sirohydrochlorin cobaltochelatase
VSLKDFSDATLLVLGHGTTQNDNSAAPVLQHAAELRRRNLFREVREAFWKQEPQVKSVLAGLSTPRVFIAPLFISEGYFCEQVIPKELGFTMTATPDSRIIRHASRITHYCRPVGTHDRMTQVLLARAAEVVSKFPFPRAPKPADLTLFIAGHGTERDPNSRRNVDLQAELIRGLNLYASVQTIFMEEEPRISAFPELCPTRNAVVVPFFISDGLHVVEDIPVLLGEPERIVKERLAVGQPTWRNPTEKRGKRVWYSSSVGSEPHLADVILERVREIAGAVSVPARTPHP